MPDMHIYHIRNKISDLAEDSNLKTPNNISLLRKHVNMLVIDDNDFLPEHHLRVNGYQIHHKADIDSIRDVEPYEVVLCDISGVGKSLGYEKEGAFIIREIHAHYPCSKRVIAYTSNTYNADYNQFFSLADFVAPKDMSIDDWINVLDEQVKKSIDPVKQWIKIRDYLLESNISTLTIAKIEDKYVRAVRRKNFEELKRYVQGEDSELGSIIMDFTSSLCARIILGLVGGI